MTEDHRIARRRAVGQAEGDHRKFAHRTLVLEEAEEDQEGRRAVGRRTSLQTAGDLQRTPTAVQRTEVPDRAKGLAGEEVRAEETQRE